MKIIFLVTGKTSEAYLKEGLTVYEKRIKRYATFEIVEIPAVSGMKDPDQQKLAEARLLLNHKEVLSADYLVLLDERGTQHSSVDFAGYLQKSFNKGYRKIVFALGGPYGFAEEVYKQSDGLLSLSRHTFSHQMIRLFFIEQVYRALTILKGEKYHH